MFPSLHFMRPPTPWLNTLVLFFPCPASRVLVHPHQVIFKLSPFCSRLHMASFSLAMLDSSTTLQPDYFPILLRSFTHLPLTAKSLHFQSLAHHPPALISPTFNLFTTHCTYLPLSNVSPFRNLRRFASTSPATFFSNHYL